MASTDQYLDQSMDPASAQAVETGDQISPATWWDFFIYLFGCVGAYVLLSTAVALIYQELNMTVTFLGALLNFLCFTGGVYLFGVRRSKLSWQGIGLLPANELLISILGGALFALVLNLFRFVFFWALLITGVDLSSLAGREEYLLIGLDTWQGVLLSLIGIGILAPIGEELFFRGLLYDWFRQKFPLWVAVLISSLLFGLAHYDSWIIMVSTFIMGIGLALAYQYTKSIWTSIFIHIFTNSGALLLAVLVIRLQSVFGL
ncbi:MAG: type II CAAX endopeptidase family protein [Chloroflexota bacterium]